MNRRNFLSTIGVFSFGAAVLQLTGCSSGSGGGAAAAVATGQNCGTADPVTALTTGAHSSAPHTLSLTQAEIASGAGAGSNTIVNVSNASGHIHSVTITPAQFVMLQNNQSVTGLVTSSDSGHTHPIDITCA